MTRRYGLAWLAVVTAVGCVAPQTMLDDAARQDAGTTSDTGTGDAARPDTGSADTGGGDTNGACPDADHDLHTSITCGGDDCDDADPQRFPTNPEVCDPANRDEDCDPSTFGTTDSDGDTYVSNACCNVDVGGVQHCGDDCDDSIPTTHPTAPEVCNGRDDDCDTAIDEGVLNTYYADADGDGYGVTSMTSMGCTLPASSSTVGGDCNDASMAIHPGAVEQCDAAQGMGTDWDCDGTRNNGCMCMSGASVLCSDPMFGSMALHGVCQNATRTCVSGAWAMCSVAPSTEVCNFLDDDCDGSVDEGTPHVTCYTDPDNDGYPASSATTGSQACPDPTRPSVGGCPAMSTNRPPIAGNIDCNSSDASVHPGAGYQSMPYCPLAMVACRATPVSPWLCVPTGTVGCPGSMLASFDYDCDGFATPEPAETCSTGGTACTTTCGTSGYTYGSPPTCGATLPYVTCGDCTGSACTATSMVTQPIGCR